MELSLQLEAQTVAAVYERPRYISCAKPNLRQAHRDHPFDGGIIRLMIFRRIADRPISAGLVGTHGILLSGRHLPHSQRPGHYGFTAS